MEGNNGFLEAVLQSENFKNGLAKLQVLHNDMGYNHEDVESRKKKVVFYLNELIDNMISEQDGEKRALISEIECLLETADKLEKELKVPINVDVDENLPLLRVKACLNERLEQYMVCRAQRVEKLASLKDKAAELSLAMGKLEFPLLPEVPSELELEDFKTLIGNFTEEKLQRTQTFEELRGRIVAVMERMELVPELDFERRVVEGKSFVLSEANMAALRDLGQTMERRLADTEELVAELREKLSVLWDRLNEPAALRDNFLEGYVGIGKATITALRIEINRCEEKKRANIKQFVLAVRDELQEYWDKCHFSAEQRGEFRHFKSDMFVEDLLDFHEQELERVKQFYKDNQRLFTLIKQRQEIWERKTELECRSKSPSRLYDNRGGKLLIEEKERKTINRTLPKIEAEMQQLASAYNQEKGEPFLVDGKSLADFISSQWEQHEAGKEMQKRERKVRNQTLGEGSAAGKRKLINTPTASRIDPKRTKIVTSAKIQTPAPIVPAQVRTARVDPERRQKIARRAFESKIAVRVPASNQNCNPNAAAEKISPDTTTYTEFQVRLENGVATRSSAKLFAYNRDGTHQSKTPVCDRNATYRAKTPVGGRTPISCMQLTSKTPNGGRTPIAVKTPTRTPLGQRSPAPLSVAKSRLYTPARNRLPFLI